jgi:3-dehydroquinate dehydratase-2
VCRSSRDIGFLAIHVAKSGQLVAICGKLAAMTTRRSGPEDDQRGDEAAHILIIHGPNLNLLGTREPEVYGSETLAAINKRLSSLARKSGAKLSVFQSNSEGSLVDRVHAARSDNVNFIVINPAAYTHTSVALRDALAAVAIPFIEIHLSNVHARESFRRHSYFSDVAVGVICGFGSDGYDMALDFAIQHVQGN